MQRTDRVAFDRRVRVEFRRTQISSDGGLLVMCEIDDALGLFDCPPERVLIRVSPRGSGLEAGHGLDAATGPAAPNGRGAGGHGARGVYRLEKGRKTAMDTFAEKYGAKYDKAVTCLTKDREALLAFYDFPAEHWDHLRTGNPIESVFATVRHRTVRTKGALSQKTAKLMVFKLVQAAAKTWRRLRGANQLPLVIEGVTFTDGVAKSATENRAA